MMSLSRGKSKASFDGALVSSPEPHSTHQRPTMQEKRTLSAPSSDSFAFTGASSAAIEHKGDQPDSSMKLGDSFNLADFEDDESSLDDGTRDGGKMLDRNLNQMIGVLHNRLGSLERAVMVRKELCAEDLQANSKRDSKMAPKISDDVDAGLGLTKPVTRDQKLSGSGKEVNLVSSDGVYMDPVRLILRTKQMTEIAKKIEGRIDESYYTSSMRETKGKKNKKNVRSEQSKKSEARRSEAKRLIRQKLEKELSANIDTYITRSVLDDELEFRCPPNVMITQDLNSITPTIEVRPLSPNSSRREFPISVRWSSRSPRSLEPDNAEAEFDPELVLQYAIERMTIVSGESTLKWLIRYPVMHEFFVYVLWFIKVKFFQKENSFNEERYLMHKVSTGYQDVVALISKKTHTQQEKDFFYEYIPYVLTNAVHYAFYYLCPGSRHFYTKGFKKTVLMQIVQVLFGFQLCPISVKVTWAKLFPDDVLDDANDEGDENVQLPNPIALSIHSGGLNVSHSKSAAQSAFADLAAPGGSRKSISNPAPKFGPRSASFGEDDPFAPSTGRPRLDRQMSSTPRASKTAQSSHISVGGSDTDSESRKRVVRNTLDAGNSNPPIEPFLRAELRPALSKPERGSQVAVRQKRETIDAYQMSPTMQQFLEIPVASTRRRQPLHRTTPINWCHVGGTDTYKRVTIPRELHDELSRRARTYKDEAYKESMAAQKKFIRSLKQIDRNCETILSSGASGKYSLELIKRQKSLKTMPRKNQWSGDSSAVFLDINEIIGKEDVNTADIDLLGDKTNDLTGLLDSDFYS
jgi:hypothetical protein